MTGGNKPSQPRADDAIEIADKVDRLARPFRPFPVWHILTEAAPSFRVLCERVGQPGTLDWSRFPSDEMRGWRRQDWLRPRRDHRQHLHRALVPDGVCRHPNLPGQRRQWSDYLFKGLCRRPLHYADILHHLCRNLGSDLLQLPAWFLGRIWRSFGSEAHRLGGESGSRPGKTSAGQKIQRAVQKPVLQCSAHVHSSLPDWARHHAVLRVGPEAKAATEARAITRAGILMLFRWLRPRVVVDTRE